MSKTSTKSSRIVALLLSGKSVAAVAKRTNVTPNYVYQVRRKHNASIAKATKLAKKWTVKASRKKGAKLDSTAASTSMLDVSVVDLNSMLAKSASRDAVQTKTVTTPPPEGPFHYTVGGIESWDFIAAKDLNYNLGSAVALISRSAYHGTALQDLKNAAAYLNREITLREARVPF